VTQGSYLVSIAVECACGGLKESSSGDEKYQAGKRICDRNWEAIQQQITNPRLIELGCRNASAGERDVDCCNDVKEGLLLDLPDECTTQKKDADTALALQIAIPVGATLLLTLAGYALRTAWNRGWRPCGGRCCP
jgi:hypothetical protein